MIIMKKMLAAALAAAITIGMCPAAEIPAMAANTGKESVPAQTGGPAAVADSGPPPLQGVTRTDIRLTDFLIEGKPQVGETLTIKLIPDGATVLYYRWARSAPDGGYSEDVSRDSSYTLTADDWNHFITVWIAGIDGVEISRSLTKPIEPAPLTGVTIEGTPQVGETLTAKVSPDGATASYAWRRIENDGTIISIGTSQSCTLTADDWNYAIEVEATGTDAYTGTQTTKTAHIQPAPLTGVKIEGKPQVGETLTAKVSPDGATASYAWRRIENDGTIISIGTSQSCTLTAADWNHSIEVQATGTNGYSGTQTSAQTNQIQPAPLTGVKIEGKPQVGETLTAKVSPDGAAASYKWRRLDASGSISEVVGTSDSYTLTAADWNCKIEVEATGTGGYTGTQTATTDKITAAISGIRIEGKPQVGETLTAKVSPDGAAASYKWRRLDASGSISEVVGTSDSYTLTADDLNHFIEAEATGTNGYTGTQTAKTDKITAEISGVRIEGKPRVGETLTAKVSPDGAAASYKWRRIDASGSPSSVVGTSDSYALTADDLNHFIEAEATGTNGYTGTQTARTTDKIALAPPFPSDFTGGGTSSTTGSSAGSSSSGGDSSSRNSPMIGANKAPGSGSTGGGNDPAAPARDVTAQLEAAKAAGHSLQADVVAKNTKSVSPETLRAMNEAAAKLGGTARFLADTTQDGKIVARMYLDAAEAANLTSDIQTGVSVDGKEAKAVADHFAKYFTNSIKVVSFDQNGPFGMNVGLAVKVDLSGLNVENLVFYSYDIAANSYKKVETTYFVDTNGYLHLSVNSGGSLIITDQALTPR